MRVPCTIVVLGTIALVSSIGVQAAAQEQGPSLPDTKAWLENSLLLPQNSMVLANKEKTVVGIRFIAENGREGTSDCFVDIFTNAGDPPLSQVSGYPDGPYPDYPTGRLNELFSLKDIDPHSITFRVGFIDAIPYMKIDNVYASTLKTIDIYSYVTFNTTNNVDRITRIVQDIRDRKEGDVRLYSDSGSLPATNSPLAEPSRTSQVELIMQTSYAPHFVKAFSHAVELCGGKTSAF